MPTVIEEFGPVHIQCPSELVHEQGRVFAKRLPLVGARTKIRMLESIGGKSHERRERVAREPGPDIGL
jgi:hypothetical protein